jgi:Mn2+/Fe2+ NRAMP family transporter
MRKRKRGPFFFLLFLGPGMLAAMADNDAGGIISYTVTGAQFGWAVFVPMTFCLVLITYTVQEMAMRLGVVAGSGYTRLLRKRYGFGWMALQVAALFLENLVILVTEFIGMSAGLELIGFSRLPAVLVSVGLVLSIAMLSGYKAKERFGLLIGMFNLLFLGFAFFVHPEIGVGESFSHCTGEPFWWYTAALIGNAVAPWMIFYQNSAYADKGLKAQYIRNGRLDTIVGCICQVAVAAALIWIGASVGGQIPNLESAGPVELVRALTQKSGGPAGFLFALGLFDSGLLAAITVSLSSSWSVADAFGWPGSLNDPVNKAPGFYGVYALSVCAAAAVVLRPGLPLNRIAVWAQVAGGILMAPILLFLTLLTSSPEVMGEYAATRGQKIRAWTCVAVLLGVAAFTICGALL